MIYCTILVCCYSGALYYVILYHILTPCLLREAVLDAEPPGGEAAARTAAGEEAA